MSDDDVVDVTERDRAVGPDAVTDEDREFDIALRFLDGRSHVHTRGPHTVQE